MIIYPALKKSMMIAKTKQVTASSLVEDWLAYA
jgi:hypothetical protein